MLDIHFIRENPGLVKKGVAAKGITADIDKLLEVDNARRKLIGEIEAKRAEQNQAGEKIAKLQGAEKSAAAGLMKELKETVKQLQERLDAAETEFQQELRALPNLPMPDVRVGKDDSENTVFRTVGEPTKFDFEPKDYMALGEALDIIDTDRAAKVSGARFGYLKGDGALLEFALVQYVLQTLGAKGFRAVVPPVMIKPEVMAAMGYMDKHNDEIYQLKDDPLVLVGTSEQSLGAMHIDETFEAAQLPRRYVGFSTCFRREAGSYGKDTRGILRVHQFDKLEMFSFTRPEDSPKEHELLLSCEEELMKGLGIPYHVLDICSGDLGTPAAKKWDVEAWVPTQKTYRETHSTSNCTDYQARRLNTGWRNPETGKRELVHTLNGTAFAIGRAIIAIIENHQQADGTIRIPEPLRPYLGGRTYIGK
jgi:seryl-tRNA synthetase